MVWTTHTVLTNPSRWATATCFSPIRRCAALQREQGGWDAEVLASLGQQLGTVSRWSWAAANANPPELLRYDATGQRLDDVRFHPPGIS